MEIKKEINPKDFEIGCIIGRFQVHKLHEGHVKLIDRVCANHKKVIIFLGVAPKFADNDNPLDFATRRAMIQERYPNVVILAQKDQRYDEDWSNDLDYQIRIPFGPKSALLYGSRDSFIPHYKGKYPVVELVTDVYYSGTEARKEVSREILNSEEFRAGIIHAIYAQPPVVYATVDILAYNDEGKILLAKKPKEKEYRFIGGFVDRTDTCWEHAARREFMEETGGGEIGDLRYVASGQINDWRYRKSKSGIMTTLYLAKFVFGAIKPSDDIAVLEWKRPEEIDVERDIMPEHQELFKKAVSAFNRYVKDMSDLKLMMEAAAKNIPSDKVQ